jgi:type 1 glutamine amidotransferase
VTSRRLAAGFALGLVATSVLVACSTDDDAGPVGSATPVTVTVARTSAVLNTPATATSRAEPADTGAPDPTRVLLFSKTAGFRHDSIGPATQAITQLGAEHGIEVVATEDAAVFSADGLAGFDAVVFLMTTGDVLDAAQQAAMEQFVTAGGGFAGVHSATDTEYDWPWYGELVGAYFESHPAIQPATVIVADPAHPSTAALPSPWTVTDEWYNFRSNVRGSARVLLTLDETSYAGGTMGADHPIAWCRSVGLGRSWYTALGHTTEQWATAELRAHVLGGLLSVLGHADADCTP